MPDRYVPLSEAEGVTGTTVVVDVLRAFTTAAYAFGQGAERIIVVSTVEEARSLRSDHQDWALMGEVDVRRIDGFDFSNSPVEITQTDLTKRTIVQRTSAGTQGVVAARNTDRLLCASFVCATATARAIDNDATFVITGRRDETSPQGEEDLACAEFISALRLGEADSSAYVDRARSSLAAENLMTHSDLAHPLDVQYACDVDRFDFAMSVRREAGLLVVAPLRTEAV